MSSPNFLLTSDLSGLFPVVHDGNRVLSIETYRSLDAAGAEQGISVSDLFAEPALGPVTDQGLRNAAWYARFAGAAVPLPQLSDDERQQAEEKLRAKLAALEPVLRKSEMGALLGRALLIPNLDSVVVVGGETVLINWGMVPESVGDDPALQAQHFHDTLGRFAGFSTPWLQSSVETTHQPSVTGQTRSNVLSATSPPEERIDRTESPTVGATHTPVPWYRTSGFIAFYASLVFALGVLLGWLLRPDVVRMDLPPGLDASDVQKGINDSLRGEIDRLRNLLDGDVCALSSDPYFNPPVNPARRLDTTTKPDTDPGSESADKPEAELSREPGETADKPISEQKSKQPDSGVADEPRQTIRDLLEDSVAMVVAPGKKQGSMGTGFFIGPDTMVTNRHVVEKGDPENIFVISQKLGMAIHAKVVATSPSSEIYQRDYAVLKLDKPVAPTTLALAPDVEKLSRVFLGGYPGFFIKADPQFEALMKGDVNSAPDMVMAPGDVVVVQKPKGGVPVVVHTALMLQGNSGGALLDACGRVVGINTFIAQDKISGRGASWSLASSDLIDFLASHNVPVQIESDDCQSTSR